MYEYNIEMSREKKNIEVDLLGDLVFGVPGKEGVGITSIVFNKDYTITFYLSNGNNYTTPDIQGEPGRGILSIDRTSGTGDPGTTDTYTITYTDGTTSTFTVYNGANGTGGGSGGSSGATFIPHVDSDGNISWTNDQGLNNPETVNIKGKDGYSVTVKSVSESTADGGSNVVTFSDGNTVTIKNGQKGNTGATGATGPTGPTGPAGNDGKTPVRGTDYWTSTDIAEIKSYVDEAILGGEW